MIKNMLVVVPRSLFLFCLMVLALLLQSCEKEKEEPAGDGFESYRYELWKMLLDDGWMFDFTGTRQDNGTYEDYSGRTFDRDHQGIGGIESDGVLEDIARVLAETGPPDIVLLGVGGNDLLLGDDPADPLDNIARIIDSIQAVAPEVIILVEQIAPGKTPIMSGDLTDRMNAFNAGIPEVVSGKSGGVSVVVAVDMYSGWKDNWLADPVHYNREGAMEVAERYFLEMQLHWNSNDTCRIMPLGDSRVAGNRQ